MIYLLLLTAILLRWNHDVYLRLYDGISYR